MPKKISEQELEAILAIVGAHPDGVQVGAIRDGLEFELPPRMLQRRLSLLAEQCRIAVSGTGKGTRYRLAGVTLQIDSAQHNHRSSEVEVELEVYIPVSPEGKTMKEAVRSPIQDREPVGYSREFLDAYRPNESFYLPEETRSHLMKMGRSSDNELPAGTYVQQIFNRLLIDLSWNSSRLEGNTYSLLETERLLEQGESAEGKNAMEAQMILNHKAAIELLVDQAAEIGFNRYTILNLHALLSDNLLADPQACGRLRIRAVGIDGTVYQQILDTATAIQHPFEQSFFTMVHLPYLQPFEDVNKRVSRLAANIPLIRRNLSPLSFVDVPDRAYIDGILGVYELNRIELLRDVFVWAYERSCARYSVMRRSLGEPDPFRLRYRTIVIETVAEVVRNSMDRKAAIAFIKQRAIEDVPLEDQARFIEVVETEVMSLHDGNIARYRLRPSEYQTWQETWRQW
jgi:Fic family protein